MKFKMLMKDGKFVDASAIGETIVESNVPFLFAYESTIESMIDANNTFREQLGHYYAARLVDNLKQCELVECEIKRIDEPEEVYPVLSLFRDLDENEIIDFQIWARQNYVPGTEIKEVWHPIIQKECKTINEENGIAN